MLNIFSSLANKEFSIGGENSAFSSYSFDKKDKIHTPFGERDFVPFCGWLFAFFKRTMMVGGGMHNERGNKKLTI